MTHFKSTIPVFAVLLLFIAASADGQSWSRDVANLITVAKKGGDFHSVQTALDAITDASRDNPYLIYVAPGVYQEQVRMKPFVSIEGAGERMTVITSGSSFTLSIGGHSELRSLTVECSRPKGRCQAIRHPQTLHGAEQQISRVTVRARAQEAVGIQAMYPFGLALDHVTIEVMPDSSSGSCSGAAIRPLGCSDTRRSDYPAVQIDNVAIRVANDDCVNTGIVTCYWDRLDIKESSIVVEGSHASGVTFYGGLANLTHVEVEATRALRNLWGSMHVHHSDVRGGLMTSSEAIQVSHSMISGRVFKGAASCFSTCDAEMNLLDGSCQAVSDR